MIDISINYQIVKIIFLKDVSYRNKTRKSGEICEATKTWSRERGDYWSIYTPSHPYISDFHNYFEVYSLHLAMPLAEFRQNRMDEII
jgi:hypothetical protein